ncbi:Haloacid dehalogenase [Planctomycetales bacterium 10988]|nr:Haloacid dehalogenase [Planctomycetales bacterium 10988]
MGYQVLATDYDGTLAKDGVIDEETIAMLQTAKDAGICIVLVTGRLLETLLEVCDHFELFDLAVVENGAVLYDPKTKKERPLAELPPPKYVETLRSRGIDRLEVGRVIVSTWRPHDQTMLETIRDLRLDRQMIFNKDAVMSLPTEITKATGLEAALKELGYSFEQTIAIGDAENDLHFMQTCALSVAVANALERVKEQADLVLDAARGAGVCVLIQKLLANEIL